MIRVVYRCEECFEMSEKGEKFCSQCGSKIVREELPSLDEPADGTVCRTCGTLVNLKWKHCPRCEPDEAKEEIRAYNRRQAGL